VHPTCQHPTKLIKLADKICNVSEFSATQPADWPLQRKLEYWDWAESQPPRL
jgi:GTP diphosphokinase / guanosine-3',5'-bis(diphosphate) 3'-diphosphatase